MPIAAMTTSHPEAQRTPPQSRPLLRVVENFRPAVDTGGPGAAAPSAQAAAAHPEARLLASLTSADRRVDALATRVAAIQSDLGSVYDALLEAETTLRARSTLLRIALVLLLPALATLAVASATALPLLTGIASAPYPTISAAVAAVLATVHEQVANNRLLTTLLLPGASVVIVFVAALVLRLKWRRGLEVSER
jgi:hypothetical protein